MIIEKESDLWETPQDLFDRLKTVFDITIDLCATESNKKAEFLGDIFQLTTLKGRTAFMNPPYSNPTPYIKKALELAQTGQVVMLLKLDPSTKWWSFFFIIKRWMSRKWVCVFFIPDLHRNA